MACYYIVISSTHLSNGHFRNIKGVFRGPLNKNGNKTLDYAEKEKTIAKALEDLKANFYCELCDKQYYKHQEFDNHINSYDHAHKQRLKELKHREYARNVASKCRRDEKKQEKALKRLHKLAELKKEVACAPGSGPMFKSTTVAVVDNSNENQQNTCTVDKSKANESRYLVDQNTANTEEPCSISGQSSETESKRFESVKTRNQIHEFHRQKILVSFSFSKKMSVKLESSAAVFDENNEEGSVTDKYDLKCRLASELCDIQSISSMETSMQSDEKYTVVNPSVEKSSGPVDSASVKTTNELYRKEEENEPHPISIPYSLPIYSDWENASYLNSQISERPSLTTGMLIDIDKPHESVCSMQHGNASSSIKGDEELHTLQHNSQDNDSNGALELTTGNHARDAVPELLETALEEKSCAIPKSETNGCSRSYRDFIPVLSKDGTTILQWPSEMLTFTSTEPSISYSCNPLCFDFKSSKPRECLASNKSECQAEARVPLEDIKPQEDLCNNLIMNNTDVDNEVTSSCTSNFKDSAISGNTKHRLQHQRYDSGIAVLSDNCICNTVPENPDIVCCLEGNSPKHKHCNTHSKEIYGKKHMPDTFSRHISDTPCHKKRKRRRKSSRYVYRESHRKDCKHFHKYDHKHSSCNDLESCSRQSENESFPGIQLDSTEECQPLQQCTCLITSDCPKESELDTTTKCKCVNPNCVMISDRNAVNFEKFQKDSKTNVCGEPQLQRFLLSSSGLQLTGTDLCNKSEICALNTTDSASACKSDHTDPEKSFNSSNSTKRKIDLISDTSDECPIKQQQPLRKHIFCDTYPDLESKPKRKRRRKRSRIYPFNSELASNKMDDITVTNVLMKEMEEDTRTLKADTSNQKMQQILDTEKLGQLQNNAIIDNQTPSSDLSVTFGFTKDVPGQSTNEVIHTQTFADCDYVQSSALSERRVEEQSNKEAAISHGRKEDHIVEISHIDTENIHENSSNYVKAIHVKSHQNINEKCSTWTQQDREVPNCQQILELKGAHINNHALSFKHQGSSPFWLPENTMLFIPEDDEKYRSLQIHTCQQIAHQIAHQHMMSNSLKFAFTGTGAQPCTSVLQPLHVQQAIASTSLTAIHHPFLQQPAAVFTGKFLQPHQHFLSQVPNLTRAPLSNFSLASGICSGSQPGFIGTPQFSMIPTAALHTGNVHFPPLPNPSLFTPLLQHATLVPLHQLF